MQDTVYIIHTIDLNFVFMLGLLALVIGGIIFLAMIVLAAMSTS